jgi:hypothetical protein
MKWRKTLSPLAVEPKTCSSKEDKDVTPQVCPYFVPGLCRWGFDLHGAMTRSWSLRGTSVPPDWWIPVLNTQHPKPISWLQDWEKLTRGRIWAKAEVKILEKVLMAPTCCYYVLTVCQALCMAHLWPSQWSQMGGYITLILSTRKLSLRKF